MQRSILFRQDIKIKSKNIVKSIKIRYENKEKKFVKIIRIKQTLKIVKELHANEVVPQEEIKFPNIKNHHVIKNLWRSKIN